MPLRASRVQLKIESDDGVTTLVRFRSAVLPEMVDGIVAE
jgi:hypothetical protein